MKENALYIQSGGPTSVINASAYGVIKACREFPNRIGKLYGVEHGTVGLIEGRLVDTSKLEEKDLELFPHTPSMIFGSCRYRIPDRTKDDSDYQKILEVLKRHHIHYIF